MNRSLLQSPAVAATTRSPPLPVPSSSPAVSKNRRRCFSLEEGARAMHFYVQSLQEGEGAGARVWWAVRRFASMQLVRSGQWMLPWRAYKASCNMWPCCCYSRWGNTMLLGYVTTNIYSRIILILGLHQHRKTVLGTTRVGAGKVNCDVAWYRRGAANMPNP